MSRYSRYIDANEMKRGIMRYADIYGHISCGVTAFNILVEQLSTEDENVVEVIRCKECRYYMPKIMMCSAFADERLNVGRDEYCSYGEREE